VDDKLLLLVDRACQDHQIELPRIEREGHWLAWSMRHVSGFKFRRFESSVTANSVEIGVIRAIVTPLFKYS
jgi:hypothetical protein